jgi:hypothetical protein
MATKRTPGIVNARDDHLNPIPFERLTRRLRHIFQSPTTRDLHLDILDDLNHLCVDPSPPTHVFDDMSAKDKAYSCKAVADTREELLLDDVVNDVIDRYMIITGKPYLGEEIEAMLHEILGARLFLEELSISLGLAGPFKAIHLALTPEDLELFRVELLIDYCDMMFIPLPQVYRDPFQSFSDPIKLSENERRDLRYFALYGKFKYMERMRIMTFIHDVLFSDSDSRLIRYNGSLIFYETPLSDEIIRNGPWYYYPRVGSITHWELSSRYHPFDLLLVLGQIRKLGHFKAFAGATTSDLTALVITSLYERGWDDPRAFVTPFGVRNTVHSPTYIPLLNMSITLKQPYEDLASAANMEGIRTTNQYGVVRDPQDIYSDYVMAQVGEDFYFAIEGWRHIEEVSTGYYNRPEMLEPHGEPRDDLVFYGGRNGTTSYYCMTIKSLTDLWEKTNRFACPFNTTKTFSIRSIRRLSYLLQKEAPSSERDLLGKVLCNMLWPERGVKPSMSEIKYFEEIFNANRTTMAKIKTEYTSSRIKTKMLLLHNLGLFLAHWDDDGPIPLLGGDGREDDLPGRRYNILAGLSSISASLEDTPYILDLRIVKVAAEGKGDENRQPYAYYEVEHEGSSIGEYLRLLTSAHRFSLDRILRDASLILMMTSETYMNALTGASFIACTRLEVEKPSIRVYDLHMDYNLSGSPELYDLVKGNDVPLNEKDIGIRNTIETTTIL